MATAGLEQMKGTTGDGRLSMPTENMTSPSTAKLNELLRGLKEQVQAQAEAQTGAEAGVDVTEPVTTSNETNSSQTTGSVSQNYTVSKADGKTRKVSVSVPNDQQQDTANAVAQFGKPGSDLSTQLHELINNNSELGSRLLSLLLVSSGNATDIINAVNNGDLSKLNGLTKTSQPSPSLATSTTGNEKKITTTTTTTTTTSDKQDSVGTDITKDDTAEDENDLIWKQLEKRRKNTEASARFRIRKKQREKEKFQQLRQLTKDINDMYDTIDTLITENSYWKKKLEELNEIKSKELLDNIKRRNGL
ncbi:Met28 [Kluyveromyces lactis]|nr:Met28 [Kluyveromyces lactis]